MISFTSLFSQERGKASFYSNRSHGKRMADGTRYDKSDLLCAHRYYPFGTLLKVTNVSNGKSVIVEVRDRGPYGRSRLIDLSYGAAKELGMINKGIEMVEIEVVPHNVVPLFFEPNYGLDGVEILMPHEYTVPVLDYPESWDKEVYFKKVPDNVITNKKVKNRGRKK